MWIDSSFTSPGRPGIKFPILLYWGPPRIEIYLDGHGSTWGRAMDSWLSHLPDRCPCFFRHGRPKNNQAAMWFPEVWNMGGSLLLYSHGFLTLVRLEKGQRERQQCLIHCWISDTTLTGTLVQRGFWKDGWRGTWASRRVILVTVSLDPGLLSYVVLTCGTVHPRLDTGLILQKLAKHISVGSVLSPVPASGVSEIRCGLVVKWQDKERDIIFWLSLTDLWLWSSTVSCPLGSPSGKAVNSQTSSKMMTT